MPKVSVVITTKNSEKTLEVLLSTVKTQKPKDLQIIVVDNFSNDRTVQIAKKYTKDIYLKGPERSTQRNFGASKSKGRYLFFLDSDMELTTGVVSEALGIIKKGKDIGGVVIPEKSFGNNYWARVKAFERRLNEGQDYFEAARFFPKAIFKEFNGYDEKITGPEDWDLPKRISSKYRIARIKCYILHNEGSPTPIKLAKRKFYYGLTAHRYLKGNKIPMIGAQTVYFLRPAFYKNWKTLLQNPALTIGLFIMLTFEMIGGGLGYLKGRILL